MEDRRNTVLAREYSKFKKQKSIDKKLIDEGKPAKYWGNIDITILNDDLTKWYVLITGLDYPYEGGEYILRIEADENHPMKPPKYYFMTPNGMYEKERNCCVSISTYHSDQYRPVLGMTGFIMNVIGAMLQWETIGHGIGLMKTSAEEKAVFAKKSMEYNRLNHIEIISMFEM